MQQDDPRTQPAFPGDPIESMEDLERVLRDLRLPNGKPIPAVQQWILRRMLEGDGPAAANTFLKFLTRRGAVVSDTHDPRASIAPSRSVSPSMPDQHDRKEMIRIVLLVSAVAVCAFLYFVFAR